MLWAAHSKVNLLVSLIVSLLYSACAYSTHVLVIYVTVLVNVDCRGIVWNEGRLRPPRSHQEVRPLIWNIFSTTPASTAASSIARKRERRGEPGPSLLVLTLVQHHASPQHKQTAEYYASTEIHTKASFTDIKAETDRTWLPTIRRSLVLTRR